MDLSFRLGWEDSPLPLFQIKKQRKALERGSWALSPGGGQPASPFVTADFPTQTDLGLKAQGGWHHYP